MCAFKRIWFALLNKNCVFLWIVVKNNKNCLPFIFEKHLVTQMGMKK